MKRFFESLRLTSPAWATLLCFAINPAAQATTSTEKMLVRAVRVSYADLDLTRQADAQLLLGRIENAAYRACGGDPRQHPSYSVIPRRTEEAFKECREDAIARAVGTINARALSQARVQVVSK